LTPHKFKPNIIHIHMLNYLTVLPVIQWCEEK